MSALTCPSCGRVSPADAAFCSGCGTKLAQNSTDRESRKVVTAMFCDLVGSTSLAERHDPEVLRPLLERYLAEAREAVERHGGHGRLCPQLVRVCFEAERSLGSIDEAAALVAPTGLAIVKADVALDRAHVLLAAGRVDDARASGEEAVSRYRTKEHEVGARQAAAMLAAMAHPG